MLIIDDLSVRIAGRLLHRPRLGPHSGRLPRRSRRPQRQRQEHAVQRHHRRRRRRARRRRDSAALARSAGWRRRRPNGPESLIDVVLEADVERTRLLERGRDRARPAPDRRNPDAARRHRRLCRAGARRLDPVRPRLLGRRPGAPLRGILRRLAHARGARGDAVRRARPPAARRADQLSRPRRHALAAGSSGALPAHHDRDQPRPRPARHLGRLHPVARKPARSRSTAAAIRTSSGCATSA